MKLVHFRGPNGERNFGDELGPWLWDRLIPGLLDADPDEILVGIGTLLNNRLPAARRIVVFGAGVGYGDSLPTVDDRWSIYCLRGPLSAQALGVPGTLAITDPGALVRRIIPPREPAAITQRFAYMPHWRYACDDWRVVCDRIGFGYIDPREDVDTVLREILRTGVLLAEAMHGAIVADALRVPWIPVRTTDTILEFKWRDWCASLDLGYDPWRIVGALSLEQPTSFRRAKHRARLLASALSLRSVAWRASPVLSDERLLCGKVTALESALERLRADLTAERPRVTPGEECPAR